MTAMKKSRIVTYAVTGGSILLVIGLLTYALLPSRTLVETALVTRGPLAETLTAEGVSRYHDSYLISTPITGYISRIDRDPGDAVRRGALLVRIAPPPLDARQMEELIAREHAAAALAEEAASRVEQAQVTQDRARKERDRYEHLIHEHATSPDLYDNVVQSEQIATGDLRRANSRLEAARQDLLAVRATRSSGTGVHIVPVYAPASGVILRIHERDARMLPAGTPVMEIGDPSQKEIVADLLSTDVARIHPGDEVRISIAGIDSLLPGRVKLIEPGAFTKVSPLGIEERRTNVIINFDRELPSLGSNYRVDAQFVLWQSAQVLRVPTAALVRVGSNWATYVIKDGVLALRRIQIGHRCDPDAEVLGGLREGDRVVISPSEELSAGSRVRYE
jgi:HlyD family secretion protein